MKSTTQLPGRYLCGAALILLLAMSFSGPFANKKAAYRWHYRGGLQYSEGRYQRAAGLFRRAYNTIPDNYFFTLSLAVCLSRIGKADEGLELMQRIEHLIDRRDPEYQQKRALRFFFEGMIYLYDGQYGSSVTPIRHSLDLLGENGAPRARSVMHNALGYAIMLNQGRGGHHRADQAPHYHVHRRDMERARDQFEQALRLDKDNATALGNYRLLSDSLGYPMDAFQAYADSVDRRQLLEPNLRNLPGNIFRNLKFSEFDEVVFLLDISGSMVMEKVVCMGETRFSVMKETAIYVLQQLPENTAVGVGTIGGDCGTKPKLWLPTGAMDDRRELSRELRFLAPDGTTPLLTMLQRSPELFADSSEARRAIFLVSDGANVCHENGVDICNWAEAMAGRGITIQVMTFLDATFNHANAFAEYTCLADNTFGKILYLDNYRCNMAFYDFSLLETCLPELPPLEKVDCWGPAVKDLWAIFPE